jgi:hypothetical protein
MPMIDAYAAVGAFAGKPAGRGSRYGSHDDRAGPGYPGDPGTLMKSLLAGGQPLAISAQDVDTAFRSMCVEYTCRRATGA